MTIFSGPHCLQKGSQQRGGWLHGHHPAWGWGCGSNQSPEETPFQLSPGWNNSISLGSLASFCSSESLGALFFSLTLMNPCYRDVSKGHGLCVTLLMPSSPALETSPSCKLACQAGASHLGCEHCLVCKLLRASFSTICFEKENVCMIICSRGSVTVYLCCIHSVWKCVLP